MYYKITDNNIITMLGESNSLPSNGIEISEEKYNNLIKVIQNKPEDTLEEKYELSNTTESYEPRETTHEEKVEWYLQAVMGGMSIDEVPEEFREEVQDKLPEPSDPTNTYGIPDETYHAIVDDLIYEIYGGEE